MSRKWKRYDINLERVVLCFQAETNWKLRRPVNAKKDCSDFCVKIERVGKTVIGYRIVSSGLSSADLIWPGVFAFAESIGVFGWKRGMVRKGDFLTKKSEYAHWIFA